MALLDQCREAVGQLQRLPRRGQRTDVGVEQRRRQWDRRALACALLALVAIGAGLAHVLSHAQQRRAGTDGVWIQANAVVPAGTTACQRRELIPAGAVALRIPAEAQGRALVVVGQDGTPIERVNAIADTRRGAIQVPIAPARADRAGVEVCITPQAQATLFAGPTPPQDGSLEIAGSATENSTPIDYLLPGRHSWWDFAGTVAARLGRGRGDLTAGGTAWLILALSAAALALAGFVVARSLVGGRGGRRTALAIAAVAALNAATWSFITPVFQVPDEVAHVAYVQSLGETGRPPAQPRAIMLSPEEQVAMADAGFGTPFARTLHAATWSPLQQAQLAADERQAFERRATVSGGEGEPEPPLYYTLESIPYRVASHDSLLDRLTLMRLLSASLAGVTALLCFLFVRECLPGRRWAWTVGGLGVAFTPMLGFVSGGVNPDALLFALSAALFLCIARAWRRGATLRLALVAGALIAAGMLTKVNFYGLVPGTLLGLTLAARRTTLAWNREVLVRVGATVLLAGTLFGLGIAFQVAVWHRPFAVGRPASPESHVSLLSHFGYVWQVFLPRLPFMAPTTLTHPGYEQLFRSFVGVFGWMVVWLPGSVYRVASIVLVLTVLLAVRTLRRDPRELRWRAREILGYATMAGALLLLVGLSADLRRDILHIVQGRYLLPLLPLFGLLLALGARGAGERWGRAVGVAIIAGTVALSLIGQLATVAFFYS